MLVFGGVLIKHLLLKLEYFKLIYLYITVYIPSTAARFWSGPS